MRKNLFIFLWTVSITSYAQNTIILDSGETVEGIQDTQPTRTVEEVDNGILVNYQFNSFIKQPDCLFDNEFFVKIDGFGLNHRAGEPSTLQRWDSFTVPENCEAQVEIIERSYKDFQFNLCPARPLLLTDQKGTVKKEDVPTIKDYQGLFPKDVITTSDLFHYRNAPIIKVGIFPIQYNKEKQTVRVFTKLKYKISFHQKGEKNLVGMSKTIITPNDSYLANTTLNCSERNHRAVNSSTSEEITKGYLIVSINDYAEPVNRFAEWKRQLGFDVHVCLRNSWSSSDEIDSLINSKYTDYGNLYYLLIVGGHEDVPSKIVTRYFATYGTDLYYGCIDNDNIPEITRGRLPVRNLQDANTVIDKIIGYEYTPFTEDASFYRKAIHCAYFHDDNDDGQDERRYVKTSEEIRNYLISKQKSISREYTNGGVNSTPTYWENTLFDTGGMLPDSLRFPSFSWNGSHTSLRKSIDNGAFYVLQSGHGITYYWSDIWFGGWDINHLNNGNKLPVIFSMACSTGKFTSPDSCFCESFLRKTNGGCVAIYGASEDSYSGPNDALAEGMFDAIWPNPGLIPTFGIETTNTNISSTPTPTYCLGQILDQGIARMYENWVATESYGLEKPIYTQEVFHLFGDPSMQIYTDMPTAFEDVETTWLSDRIIVNTGGETATISFYNKETGEVKAFLGNQATLATSCPEDFSVCVSAHNKIPYIETPDILYIQNVTTTGTSSYNADYIKVGTNVTEDIPFGNVTLGGSQVTMTGKNVVLKGTTTVPLGTILNINP